MTKSRERLLAYSFGVVFTIVMLTLAILIPEITPFQYTVFKVVLALAAAGVASMTPGFLEVEIPKYVRAGGAMGVFVLVLYYSPANLVIQPPPDRTELFEFVFACNANGENLVLDSATLPYSDVKAIESANNLTSIIAQLPKGNCDFENASIFRMKDEVRLGTSAGVTATSGNNLGLIIVPASVISSFPDEHTAFSVIYGKYKKK